MKMIGKIITTALLVGSSVWTTALIRPTTAYTNKIKAQQLLDLDYDDKSLGKYEEDHIISLQLGGNPTDPKNLFPELYTVYASTTNGSSVIVGAREKDRIEGYLKREVCVGHMTLKAAQDAIKIDWLKIYIEQHPEKKIVYPIQNPAQGIYPPKGYGTTNPNITQKNIGQTICAKSK